MKDHLIRIYWQIKKLFFRTVINTDVNPTMVSNPLLKWPRYFNCVCGSGKKFKKCCLPQLAGKITTKDAFIIEQKLSKYRV